MIPYKIIIAIFITILISLDTINTGVMVQYGYDLEANPIMRWVLENFSEIGFGIVKLSTIFLILIIISNYWNYVVTKIGVHLIAIVYTPIVIHQIRTIL